MLYLATYAATVEANNDPENLGRVKARAPTVYGPAVVTPPNTLDAATSVPTESLPWAMPAGLPAGGTAESGAVLWVPNVGDHVYLRFLDGLPEQPLWEWAMQDRPQADGYPCWREAGYGDGTPPRSALITRHGHAVELNPDYVQLRVASGLFLRLRTTGELEVWTRDANVLLERLEVAGATHTFTPSAAFNVDTAAVGLRATEAKIETKKTTLVSLIDALVQAPHVELGPAGKAVDPVVRLSDLQRAITTLTTVFNAHLHVGNLGRPTSPPTTPLRLTPTGSSTTFTA
jgi:hypothetical protein